MRLQQIRNRLLIRSQYLEVDKEIDAFVDFGLDIRNRLGSVHVVHFGDYRGTTNFLGCGHKALRDRHSKWLAAREDFVTDLVRLAALAQSLGWVGQTVSRHCIRTLDRRASTGRGYRHTSHQNYRQYHPPNHFDSIAFSICHFLSSLCL